MKIIALLITGLMVSSASFGAKTEVEIPSRIIGRWTLGCESVSDEGNSAEDFLIFRADHTATMGHRYFAKDFCAGKHWDKQNSLSLTVKKVSEKEATVEVMRNHIGRDNYAGSSIILDLTGNAQTLGIGFAAVKFREENGKIEKDWTPVQFESFSYSKY